MYGCESCTIKKSEHWRIDAFKLWCWRRLLRVSWTGSRTNHSILKEMNPEYSLEGLMLKLKLKLWPPDGKSQLTEKDPDAGKDWRREEKRVIEDEMVGWHHQLSVRKEGQGSLMCYGIYGITSKSDMTLWLNNIRTAEQAFCFLILLHFYDFS